MTLKLFSKVSVFSLALVLIASNTFAFQSLSTTPSDSGFQSAGAYMLSKDNSGTYDRSTDSLEAIRDKIDTLPWTTGGSDIYFSTGDVGIGTTAPTQALDVKGSTDGGFPATSGTTQTSGWLRLHGGYNAVIDMGTSGANGGWVQVADIADLGTEYPLLLNPNGGDVGIGVGSPTAILEVGGTLKANSRITAQYTSALQDLLALQTKSLFRDSGQQVGIAFKLPRYTSSDTTAYPLANIWAETTDAVHGSQAAMLRMTTKQSGGTTNTGITLDDSGNVGIGTTSPSAILHTLNGNPEFERNDSATISFNFVTNKGAARDLSFQNDGGDFQIRQSTGIGSQGKFKMYGVGSNTTPVSLYFNAPDNSLYLNSSGNLGLGTASPNQKLTISGTMDLAEQAAANTDTAAYGQIWVKNDTPNTLWFTDDAGTDTQLGAGGDVVDDTTPQLGGNLDMNSSWISGDGDSEGIYIDTSGNVGIGTTAPQRALSVATTGDSYGINLGDAGNATGKHLSLGYFQTADYARIDSYDFNTTAYKDLFFNGGDITLKADGSVGIGLTAPNEALTVEGTLSLKELLTDADADTNYAKLYAKAGSTLDSYTSLLLSSDHTDGSTSFTDTSGNSHTITPYGNAQHDTDQHYFGASAIYFDGAGDMLYTDSSEDFNMGTGDFTVDCWYRPTSKAQSYPIIWQLGNLFNDTELALLDRHASYSTKFSVASATYSGGVPLVSDTTVTNGVWYHIAVVRSGTNLYLFINGVLEDSVADFSDSVNTTDKRLNIGMQATSSATTALNGHIDELRVTKGVARWTGNFTPPTVPYLSETAGLYYKDGSGNVLQLGNPWTISSSDIYRNSGNVGIGTTAPGAKLEVDGLIIPDKVTADPCSSGAPEGGLFYNDTGNYFCYCDGTNDVKMHDPTTACF